jgi:hypothetical protein
MRYGKYDSPAVPLPFPVLVCAERVLASLSVYQVGFSDPSSIANDEEMEGRIENNASMVFILALG